ncbi:hypothetical protein BGP_1155 [Beggiatoa sp. PS]|nr:hypothetical protein BGP_1155 [Beggiatoa sp. PS]
MEQFEQMPVESVNGFTAENLGGLSTDVIGDFKPEHVAALDVEQFQQLPSEEVSEFLTHLSEQDIAVADAEGLIPPGWDFDPEQGTLKAPPGSKIKLQTRKPPVADAESITTPTRVKLPAVPDFDKGFGLAGKGTSILDDVTQGLKDDDFGNLIPLQNEFGIIEVEDINELAEVKNFAFMPNSNNITQVGADALTGLGFDSAGFYELTTPGDLKMSFVPVPKNPTVLSSELLNGGEVQLGDNGDVLMEFPDQPTESSLKFGIFDAGIESAPEGLEPGVHWSDNPNDGNNWAVYSDGTAQKWQPTVYSPNIFIELGKQIEGVESITYNANGTFTVVYYGQTLTLTPRADPQTKTLAATETVEPGIAINNDNTLTYSTTVTRQTTTTRRGVRQSSGNAASAEFTLDF